MHYPSQDFEVIIVDDSDVALDLNRFRGGPALAQIKPSRRMGLPHARNIGISNAKGEILCFLDDDVILDEDWLSCIMADYAIQGVGGVGGRATFRSFDEFDHSSSRVGTISYDGHIHLNFNYPRRTFVQFLHGTNMSYRASVVRSVGGFNEGLGVYPFGEDHEFGLRVSNEGWKLVYEPAACAIHGGIDVAFHGSPSQRRRRTFRLDNVSPRTHAFWSARNETYIRLAQVRMPIKWISIVRCLSGNFRMFFLRTLGDESHPTRQVVLVAYATASGLVSGVAFYLSQKAVRAGRSSLGPKFP